MSFFIPSIYATFIGPKSMLMRLQFQQKYPVNILILWDALTKPEHMKKWFFPQLKNFKAKTDFTTSFKIFQNNHSLTHLSSVISVTPYSYIKHQWSYLEYPGSSIVAFRLKEMGSHSILKFEHTVTADFPSTIFEFSKENTTTDSTYLLTKRLKKYLKEKYLQH